MCGIAGLIHRGKSSNVGSELQGMLQALKHRGEDSTGYALYGDTDGKNFIMRFKVGENVGEGSSSVMEDVSVYDERKKVVDQTLAEIGAKIVKEERTLPYSLRYELEYDAKDLLNFSQTIEAIPGVEILSMGKSLEVIKDLGNAKVVCDRYSLDKLVGTHAIGHARMATESGVDIKSAHPFWGYPFSDVSVVHNGQLTNYWNNRRVLENKGMRFMSECDSELIAVYIAQKMREGATLEEGMKDSLLGLDGVFTYFVATKDSLGMAKDTMAAKPLVLYESDDLVAMGSEEIAIRSVLPQEIDTYDTICAADLIAPKKGYLELEAHPPIIIPYTPNDETAKRYKIPTLMSARTKSSPNGITAHDINANVIVTTGANTNTSLFELAGIIISLKIYFNASANDWNKPNGPTTLGPLRFCTKAQTLLSSQTIIATETKTGTNKNKILYTSKKIIFI